MPIAVRHGSQHANAMGPKFKDEEGWSEVEFVKLRMEQKIELLKGHLPEFLARNKKVYSILSKGIHELQEYECLRVFEILKHAIFFILDEDKRRHPRRIIRYTLRDRFPQRRSGQRTV